MKTPITFKYVFITLVTVGCTWLIHEFAHWSVGNLLGYKMQMSLNSVSVVEGNYNHTWEHLLVSAAGPFITILQAVVAWVLIMKRPNQFLFPLIFIPFYFRLLAGLMNFINLNDEGRISEALELGVFTLPTIVSLFLFVLVYATIKKLYLKTSFIVWTTLFVMIFSSAIILADQYFKLVLI